MYALSIEADHNIVRSLRTRAWMNEYPKTYIIDGNGWRTLKPLFHFLLAVEINEK